MSLSGAVLSPAFGRDYSSRGDVVAAFEAGRDFVLCSVFHGSGYVSARDFTPGDRVQLRYGKLRKTTVHVVKGGAA